MQSKAAEDPKPHREHVVARHDGGELAVRLRYQASRSRPRPPGIRYIRTLTPQEVAGVTTLQEGQLTGAQRRQFVRDHRTAIFAYGRNNDGPAMSALYYVMDGDDLLISTMRARAKAKAVQRNPKVSLCILDENWPPTYLTVFCDAFIDATVDTDLDAIVDLALRVGALMA